MNEVNNTQSGRRSNTYRRFDVSMDDVLRVKKANRTSDLHGDTDTDFPCQSHVMVLQESEQVASHAQFSDDVRSAEACSVRAGVVACTDVLH